MKRRKIDGGSRRESALEGTGKRGRDRVREGEAGEEIGRDKKARARQVPGAKRREQ